MWGDHTKNAHEAELKDFFVEERREPYGDKR